MKKFSPLERKHFTSLPSTNAWAKKHLNELDKNTLTLVTTEEQTNGYGQFQRSWLCTPKKNITATLVFFLPKPHPALSSLTLLLALTICEEMQKESLPTKIKWPNDIMLAGKKMGGVLCECEQASTTALVLGFGLNINENQEFLEKVPQAASSPYQWDKKERDPEEVLQKIVSNFQKKLPLWLEEGLNPFLKSCLNHCLFLDEAVSIQAPTGTKQGFFTGLTEEGFLKLHHDGKEEVLVSGSKLSLL